MVFRLSIRLVIALGAVWLGVSASAVAGTAGVVGAQQQMLGAMTGERHVAAGNFRMSWELPTLPQLAAASVDGGGAVIYHLQDSTIRVAGEALPVLHGRLPVSKALPNPPHVVTRGMAGSVAAVQWGVGRDVLCRGLGVVVEIREADTGDLLATVQQEQIGLTTGTVMVGDIPAAGGVDLQQMQVRFVGTFPMPATGNKKVDALLAGQPVLMRLTVSAKPLQ